MTTTHDVHRAIEENLFNSFQRHSSIHSPATASLASFRSMTASDLIGVLPGTPHSSSPQRQRQRQHQQRVHMARDRPASDILQPPLSTNAHLTEAEAIDQWFENIQRYEQMLEEVAAASLDETFKDELQHVNQWIRCRSDAERTAALYSVVQNASQIQIRFLIMVLQQLANQEPFGNSLTPAGQDKDSLVGLVAGSVVSTESEYERRKRQMYPHITHRHNGTMNSNPRPPIRITSASSEPDDLNRNRDLFNSGRYPVSNSSTISSALGRQGLLHEKALAARAQIQAVNRGRAVGSAKSDSFGGRIRPLLSSTSSTPTNTTSSSSSSSSASLDSPSSDTLQQHPSLFGTDWPFPLTRHTPERSTLVGRIGDHRSTISKSSLDDTWSFGSLSKKKKDLIDIPSWNGRKSGPIREEQESMNALPTRHQLNIPASSKPLSSPTTNSMMASTLNNSLSALEQAQARLRGESMRSRQWPRTPIHPDPHTLTSDLDVKLSTASAATPAPLLGSTSSTSSTSSSSHTSMALTPPLVHSHMNSKRSISPSAALSPIAPPSSLISPPLPAAVTAPPPPPPPPVPQSSKMTIPAPLGQFVTPPTVYENQVLETEASGYHSDHSETSTTSAKDKVLTGTARRRKRSSAARAMKDKIAAETVDLDLMKDVQNWLRSLRLHKYGHAFTGLQWQQVIRMNDQDMIDAGVNTIGARRKLLKVFENVQRHCDENNIDY